MVGLTVSLFLDPFLLLDFPFLKPNAEGARLDAYSSERIGVRNIRQAPIGGISMMLHMIRRRHYVWPNSLSLALVSTGGGVLLSTFFCISILFVVVVAVEKRKRKQLYPLELLYCGGSSKQLDKNTTTTVVNASITVVNYRR
jgi:hypothetical protein